MVGSSGGEGVLCGHEFLTMCSHIFCKMVGKSLSSLAGGSLAFQAGTGLFLPLNRPFFLGAQLSCHFCPLLFIPSSHYCEHPLRRALPILGTASMLLAEFSSVSSLPCMQPTLPQFFWAHLSSPSPFPCFALQKLPCASGLRGRGACWKGTTRVCLRTASVPSMLAGW